jgi:hypothetical protein
MPCEKVAAQFDLKLITRREAHVTPSEAGAW